MTKKSFPSQELEKFVVRMPDGLRQRLADAAEFSKRSMNAEIVHRLLRSLEFDQLEADSQSIEGTPEMRLLQSIAELQVRADHLDGSVRRIKRSYKALTGIEPMSIAGSRLNDVPAREQSSTKKARK